MYPPSSVLNGCGVNPEQACEATGLTDLDGVPIKPAPKWMTRLWRGPVAAMTLPWAIYVDRRHLASGEIGPLILHELVHVRQWQRLGTWRFLRIYVTDYLRNRRAGMDHDHAYLGIRLEKEARVAVAKHLAGS
jgi:hypothetical protein